MVPIYFTDELRVFFYHHGFSLPVGSVRCTCDSPYCIFIGEKKLLFFQRSHLTATELRLIKHVSQRYITYTALMRRKILQTREINLHDSSKFLFFCLAAPRVAFCT